jgi:hypothetical protein
MSRDAKTKNAPVTGIAVKLNSDGGLTSHKDSRERITQMTNIFETEEYKKSLAELVASIKVTTFEVEDEDEEIFEEVLPVRNRRILSAADWDAILK